MVFQANLQNPTLTYLRRNEVPAAIRNLYNDFVACYYPSVNAFTEEFRQWRSPSGPFYKIPDEAKFVNRVRDLLVREEGDTLWLAAGTPRRWLARGEGGGPFRADLFRSRQLPPGSECGGGGSPSDFAHSESGKSRMVSPPCSRGKAPAFG